MNTFNDLFLQGFNNYSEGNIESALDNLNNAERNFLYYEDNKFTLEDLYILRGTISLSQNSLESARIDFEKALKSNPNSSEACLGLGQYFFAKGQYENSKTMFEWAVKNNPEHPAAQKALANVNSKLNLSVTDSSLNPKSQQSEINAKKEPLDEASELFAQKNYQQALLKLFETRKQYEVNLASVENFIAFNYLELNEIDKTREAAERALKLNPFSSQAYATLGEIYYRDKNYSEAKKMFEIALRFNSANNFAKTGLEYTEQALGTSRGNGKAHSYQYSNSF